MTTYLITGGAGFIGSNFVRYLLRTYPDAHVVVLDKLTYAGNRENLADVEAAHPEPVEGPTLSKVEGRLTFIQGDICDAALVERTMVQTPPQVIVNFAAESHVDRSLLEAGAFVHTDVYGTFVLLEAALRQSPPATFLQISTDEVYGQILEGSWSEEMAIAPRNPYSASKAGAELLALAYHRSHGLPVLITRSGNNFGPYQHPEKMLPLMITNALEDQPLPIYGDGLQERDWLYVEDHCEALELVLKRGQVGQVYNIGAGNERPNLEVIHRMLELLGKPRSLIRHVADRLGHDRRYSLDWSKLRALGWTPRHTFEEALQSTVSWYVERQEWWRRIKAGEFQEYYQRQYGERLGTG